MRSLELDECSTIREDLERIVYALCASASAISEYFLVTVPSPITIRNCGESGNRPLIFSSSECNNNNNNNNNPHPRGTREYTHHEACWLAGFGRPHLVG